MRVVSIVSACWRQGTRALAFASHIPLGKLIRRAEREVRQRVRDLGGMALVSREPRLLAEPSLRPDAPRPLFAPRGGLERLAGGGRRLTFLNRAIEQPGSGIDWRAPGAEARDQLWRMNLHYMEYLESCPDGEAEVLMLDWIAANPWNRPRAWRDAWNTYALSIRVVVWLQQLALRSGRLDPGAVARIRASIVRQLLFLERNLETDLGGNHLIKNIKALIWSSANLDGPDAARWRAKGVKFLAREISHQVLPDGMHDERSASYHAQVFADLLECRQALGGDPFGGRLDDALHRMAQVTADLAHPDGRPALFNDSGLTMAYAPGACLDVYERLLGRRPQARAVFALPDAGYFGLRAAGSYFLADCGRIAPDDLPGHGHGDVLSFEWSVAGRRVIVDQGVFEYHAGLRRERARAAGSHNTLAVQGTDQADFFGAFRCGRRPNVTIRRYDAAADGFVLEGSHDGYARLPGGPVHVRRFEVGPRRISIRDHIEGRTDRRASLGFLLAPDVKVTAADGAVLLMSGAQGIRLVCSSPIEVEDAVWWPDMGREVATRRLRAVVPAQAQETLTTLEIA